MRSPWAPWRTALAVVPFLAMATLAVAMAEEPARSHRGAGHASPAAPARLFEVVDLMPAFWSFWEASRGLSLHDQQDALRTHLLLPHARVYRDALDLAPDEALTPQFERWLHRYLSQLGPRIPHMRRLSAQVRQDVPLYRARFMTRLPDFHWRGRVFLMPSIDGFDGMTAPVEGEMALLIGIDNLAGRYGEEADLELLLYHELFHLYHAQHLEHGEDTVLNRLWREGLATYASGQLAGRADEGALLFDQALLAQADPIMPAVAGALLRSLSSTDPELLDTYFNAGDRTDGVPRRSGYLVGLRVAQALGRDRYLQALSRIPASSLRREIEAALSRLASGS